MDENYWEAVASDYDGEIFDSFASDRRGVLRKRLDEFANPAVAAADAGCGVGKYLPALAPRFQSVDAYDLSASLLEQARAKGAAFSNIRYFKRDFAAKGAKVNPVGFVLCANVLIMAQHEVREGILHNVARMLQPGGHALFLVPSLESAILTHHRMVQWHRRDGLPMEAAMKASSAPAARAGTALRHGLVPLEKVPTKHFLREEMTLFLQDFGFESLRFDKVEYRWTTEFENPPDWMKAPYPWDWLVSVRRV